MSIKNKLHDLVFKMYFILTCKQRKYKSIYKHYKNAKLYGVLYDICFKTNEIDKRFILYENIKTREKYARGYEYFTSSFIKVYSYE